MGNRALLTNPCEHHVLPSVWITEDEKFGPNVRLLIGVKDLPFTKYVLSILRH